ncbi:MAG: DMT family transporter [Roseovarius sp.]
MSNIHGILLVVAAMAGFTIEDLLIKQLTETLPVGQLLMMLGVASAVIFALLSRLRGHSVFARAAWRPVFLVRALAEAAAALSFVTALSLVDISVVAAVFQATPLVITMGAALFLGEQVGWRRWSAIGLGFLGVLVIIRPGFSGFEPAVLFVLITVAAIAARDLVTRRMDVSVPSMVIAFQGFAVLVPAGAVLLALGPAPAQGLTGMQPWMMLGAVATGAASYYCIVHAMRIADASSVMPFRYTRLLFSLIAGVLVFGERPDALTLGGATLIMATGLYTFLREQRLARRARRADALASGPGRASFRR